MRPIILVLITRVALAALPSTIVFEVRPTVGADTAGGCFDSAKSGTDYSQQNSAQYAFTDLVITATNTIVSSASHNFVAADVGNCIQITAGTGFTTGVYEITSTGSNDATLDRAAGTASSTGGTWNEGGAFATVIEANSVAVASSIIWIKNTGTYTVTSSMTINLQSTSAPATSYSIIGYSSTRGDGGSVSWTTSTNSIDLIDFTDSINVVLQNINFSSTAGTKAFGLQAKSTGNSISVYVVNCTLTGFTTAIYGDFNVNWSFQGLYILNSRIYGNSLWGVDNSANTFIFGSRFDTNTSGGILVDSGSPEGSLAVSYSIIYDNTGPGISFSPNPNSNGGQFIRLDHDDISTNGSSGIVFGTNTSTGPLDIYNTIIDSNGGYGIDGASGTTIKTGLWYNNAFYNNTSGTTRNIQTGIGTITLTASPYTTIGSNFALNSTSGGGAALKEAGFPGVIKSSGTGYTDIGAIQSMASASGGQIGAPIIQ